MTSKSNSNKSAREKYSEDMINEILGEVENEPDIEIESDVANLGEEESDVKIAESPSEKRERKKKGFFAVGVAVILFAIIGLVSSINFIINGIHRLADNTALKNEFARFILPVVANDIAPFENESEITNTSKINCSIWNILVNKDTSGFKKAQSGGILIPEYNVSVSCKELFGTGASIEHQTVGAGDSRFSYDAENHVYTCANDLRFLTYAPRITGMTKKNDTYVLTVEYLPPSITTVGDDLGIEIKADKILEYTVNRYNKKNTLISVRLIKGADTNM